MILTCKSIMFWISFLNPESGLLVGAVTLGLLKSDTHTRILYTVIGLPDD
jgi:hypothetical protein